MIVILSSVRPLTSEILPVDADRFDALARTLGARLPRRSLGALVAAALTTLGLEEAKAKSRRNSRKREQDRARDPDGSKRRKDDRRDGEAKHHDDGRLDAVGKKKGKKGKKKKRKSGNQSDGGSSASPPLDGGSTLPPPDSGGGTPCATCAATCRTCDSSNGACVNECKGVDCPGSDRACAVVQGGHHQQLAEHLSSLGYVPEAGGTSITLLRAVGAVDISEFVTSYTQSAGPGTAQLRTVVNAAGESLSMALVVTGEDVGPAYFVGEPGDIQQFTLDMVPDTEAVAAAAVPATAFDACQFCKDHCQRDGVTVTCNAMQTLCGVLTPGPLVGKLLAWLACNWQFAIACQDAGNKQCDEICKKTCQCPAAMAYPCGDTCCNFTQCQTCKAGQCVSCDPEKQYCREVQTKGEVGWGCTSCPQCEGVCEVITPPTDVASGTPACPERRCMGSCPDGPNYDCVEPGVCVCTAKDCRELGKECGSWDNGCGGTITCGGHDTCQKSGQRPNAFCDPDGKCACPKNTCHSLGDKTCGTYDDGCGGRIDCGECDHLGANAYCDGGICRCDPKHCYDFTNPCGMRDDGCGGTIDCGQRCTSQSQPNGYCDANGQCACKKDTCASLGKTCGTWYDGCSESLTCGPQELVCGTSNQPICCAEGQTCCPHGPDYWGLPSECCDWSVCHRYPGGAFKGCCPAVQQCTENNGTKTCCPDGWTCRAGSSHPATNCCVMSGQGHEALHLDPSLCCSGELATMWPHSCK